ncbi:MAG: TonB C-terminal domain-containing protein, partial [Pontiella sp.]|nr:TonB C-terminal domain-containing protein [Pontiella sp.]
PEPPAPAPTPEPAPIPEPAKQPTPTPKPKPPEPEKPKWKPTPVDQIKKGRKLEAPAPQKPLLSEKVIKKQLSGIVSSSKATGNSNDHAAYDAHIYTVFYNAWKQPASPAMRPAEVTISILSNGRITKRKLTSSSGDSQYDEAVMTAVQSITMLPQKPPAGYPLDNIVVQFRIID